MYRSFGDGSTIKNVNPENTATPLPGGAVERTAVNNRQADRLASRETENEEDRSADKNKTVDSGPQPDDQEHQ